MSIFWTHPRDGIPVVASDFSAWLEEAQVANVTYNRVRKQQYDSLIRLINHGRRIARDKNRDLPEGDGLFGIKPGDFQVLKSCLTSKQDNFDDNKRLAYDRTVNEMFESLIEFLNEDEEDDQKAYPHIKMVSQKKDQSVDEEM